LEAAAKRLSKLAEGAVAAANKSDNSGGTSAFFSASKLKLLVLTLLSALLSLDIASHPFSCSSRKLYNLDRSDKELS
jgi:hypothetical protein